MLNYNNEKTHEIFKSSLRNNTHDKTGAYLQQLKKYKK